MAASIGRNFKIKDDTVVLAGVRTKTVTWGGEPVDVTTDDEASFRTLLAEAGQQQIDMTVEGVIKDDNLRGQILNNGGTIQLTDINVEYPNGDTITGNFVFVNYEETGTYNDAVTFTCGFQSSGQWTYTAAP